MSVVLAVFGIAMNTIVAWCCAALVDLDDVNPIVTMAYSDQESWRVLSWSGAGAKRICSQRYDGAKAESTKSQPGALVPGWTRFDEPTLEWVARSVPFESRLADARGWPLPSLYSVTERALSANKSVHGGFAVFDSILPLRPVWSGLLLDSAFFAFVAALLCAPLAIRRFRRLWQSRCVKCGYPIGQSRRCTECGRVLDRQTSFAPAAA
jgi:hypothetical protein